METKLIYNILKYYRVFDWIHYLGYVLLPSILVGDIKIINFVVAALLLAYAYSINDYYDKKIKKRYFLLPLILYFITVPLLSYYSFLISLLFLILFTLYSWPKVWFEGRPIISTIANSIGFTLIFMLPLDNIKQISNIFTLVILIFLLNTAAQLLHEIVDFRYDKKRRKITTTVYLGVNKSLIFFKVCLLLVILLSLLILKEFSLISLSSIFFSFYFLGIRKCDLKVRENFKTLGIIVGLVYMLDLLRV
jgi:4-hydroxybenzoate polyprenyltransferase